MTQILKQSTAVDVLIGPFVDKTDGATAETGESPSVKLSKNGQTLAAKNDATTPVHDADGYYNCELDATDTNTVGTMILTVAASADALPVRHELQVIEEAIYDGFYAASAARIPADATAISGDTTAADNLELQYDTTGLTGDTFPATQAQLGNLSTGSAALSAVADTDNTGGAIKGVSFVGVETSGAFTDIEAEDNVYHNITHSANVIDIVYGFSLQGNQTPVAVVFHGYLNSANDTMNIQAYNFVGAAFETRGSISGQGGSSNITETVTLLARNVGTSGGDLGKIYIRIENTGTSPDLFTDAIFVEYTQVDNFSGYEGGAVWLDTNTSNTNTVVGVDGIITNPVSTIAAAKTLLSSTNLHIIHGLPGSSFTLADNSDNLEFIGAGYSLALGGQSINGTTFVNATITGIGEATTTQPVFIGCAIGAATIPPASLSDCGIGYSGGTFTAAADAGEYVFNNCFSERPGTAVSVLDFSAVTGTTGINNRRWAGGCNYTLTSDCTLSHEVGAGGGTTVTTGGADVEIRGDTRSVDIVMSAAETVQIVGVTGPIDLSGTTTGTVNIYGVSASLTDTTTAATVTDKTLSQDNIASGTLDLDDAIETGITLRQAQRAILAASAGKLSGAGSSLVRIRDAGGDTKDRIDATVDSDGNRISVTLDLD